MDTPRFRFSNPRHEQTHRRLLLIGPGPAAQYRDACKLMSDDCETQTHLVSHLLREIESALRGVLEPIGVQKTRKGVSGDERHRDEIITILNALDIPITDSVAQAWLRLPGKDNEYGLAGRAHRRALGPPRKMDAEFRSFWEEFNGILDAVLERFEAHYLASLKTLEGLLSKETPGDGDVKVLRNNVPNNQVSFRFLFEKLQNPAWLSLLRDAGLFADPPGPDRESEPGMVSYPPWPQAHYLQRMASIEPGLVCQIALGVDDKGNVSVRDDIVQIALALPADVAQVLVPKVKGWAKPPHLLIVDRLVELVVHLASSGLTMPALELASGVFALHAEPEEPFDLGGGQIYQPSPKVAAYMDHWEYQEGLKQVLPALLAAEPKATLEWLAEMLESALDLHGSEYGVPSDSWRPSIEESNQNVDLDVKGPIVAALRDATLSMVRRNPGQLGSVLKGFEARRSSIFRRIGLYLLSVMPDASLQLIGERLADRSSLKDTEVYHEYAVLLKLRFARLNEDQQSTILSYIAEGPASLEGARARHKERTGKEMTGEAEDRIIRHWQQRRLTIIKDFLPPHWQQTYGQMVVEFGDVEHPEFLGYMSAGAVGPTSPKSAKDLSVMSVSEIVAYLRSWQPTPQPFAHFGPSREGLSRELVSVIKDSPGRFAADSVTFKDLDATYVRALFEGLEQAAREKQPFSWKAVLELAAWAVAQPLEIPGRGDGYSLDADPSWAWAQAAAAGLITAGFDRDLPLDLRDSAWRVLELLTSSTADAGADALESVRDKALRTVIRYALWLGHHGEQGFARMPEVRTVLEAHLDPTAESDRIHGLYGEMFPLLLFLDPDWTTSHLDEIFPVTKASHRDAAWNAYISFCHVYDDTARVLAREYERAIQEIGPSDDAKQGMPTSRVAEHLMVLYARGQLQLEPGGLLDQFYHRAPDALRAHALSYLGLVLRHTAQVPEDWAARMSVLWKYRVEVSKDNPQASQLELASIGHWFVARKLDESWMLEQIGRALSLVRMVRPEYMVMRELAAICERRPREALDCASMMVTGAREVGAVYNWTKQIRTILGTALKSADAQTKQNAVELINRLGAMGHLEFASLLN